MSHLDILRGIVGDAHVITGADATPYLTDWRERYSGHALAVVRPGSTAEVAAVVRSCASAGVPIVPQGGNTGLCGGATPDDSGRAVVVLLQRLNRIRGTDLANDTMEVEAGCVLQLVQQAARDAGRLFPLSLAAEGSCTIGGNLATNAGGTQVLRYGSMRALTLGLEVVTAQGEIWHGLRALRKDNTGYDLRDLYIGSEGTLGIITAATLKLYPQPVARCTALLALASIDDAIAMLTLARHGFGASLTGFELMSGACLDAVVHSFPQQRLPFDAQAAALPWHALLEVSDSESEAHARERFETILGEAMASGCVKDAVIAGSMAQSQSLWHLRESIPLAEKAAGKSIKHDVSIPVSRMAAFVRRHQPRLAAGLPRYPPHHLRPPRRRQPALQRGPRSRSGRSRSAGRAGRHLRARARPRPRRERIDQRRTRRGPTQARCAAALQESGRARPDALGEARAGPAGDHESGEGAGRWFGMSGACVAVRTNRPRARQSFTVAPAATA